MTEDDHTEIPAAGPQLVRWLRALADAVERDPALAARIAAEVAPPSLNAMDNVGNARYRVLGCASAVSPPGPSPSDDGEGRRVASSLDRAEISAFPVDEAASIAQSAPTVRHGRRATKYGAPAVAGRAPELGAGVPDPFAIATATGEEGLQRALATLRAGSLRAIIRTHQLDPKGKLPPTATEERMITVILTAVKKATAPPKAKSGKGSKRV